MKARRRGRRKKRVGLGTWLKQRCVAFANWFKQLSKPKKALFITCIVLLILVAAVVAYAVSLYNKMETDEVKEEDIIISDEHLSEEVKTGYTNFVLFGSDSRSDNVTKNLNTDTIIIVSLNNTTKEIKMLSVYRDTLLDMTNGSIQKCNSAYARGGAAQAINMLNMNLDLNIQKYVTVSFSAVADVIDMLGGIEVDVSEKEMKAVNKYIDETGRITGKKAVKLTRSGLQTLNGVQAATYARIRKGVGDDFARTERQRLIIKTTAEKAMKSDFATINSIINAVLSQVSTNFSMTEILSYAKDFAKYSFGETSGFPFERKAGMITGRGSCVYATDLKENVSMLHEFLFGTVGYEPSDKVVSISDEVDYLVATKKSNSSSNSKEDDEDEDSDKEVDTEPSEDEDATVGDDATGEDNTGTGGTTGEDNTGTGGTTGGNDAGTGGTIGGDNTGTGGTTDGDNTGTGGTTGGDDAGTGGTTGGDSIGTGGDNTETGGTTGEDNTGTGGTTGGDNTGTEGPTESGETISEGTETTTTP